MKTAVHSDLTGRTAIADVGRVVALAGTGAGATGPRIVIGEATVITYRGTVDLQIEQAGVGAWRKSFDDFDQFIGDVNRNVEAFIAFAFRRSTRECVERARTEVVRTGLPPTGAARQVQITVAVVIDALRGNRTDIQKNRIGQIGVRRIFNVAAGVLNDSVRIVGCSVKIRVKTACQIRFLELSIVGQGGDGTRSRNRPIAVGVTIDSEINTDVVSSLGCQQNLSRKAENHGITREGAPIIEDRDVQYIGDGNIVCRALKTKSCQFLHTTGNNAVSANGRIGALCLGRRHHEHAAEEKQDRRDEDSGTSRRESGRLDFSVHCRSPLVLIAYRRSRTHFSYLPNALRG